MSSTYLWRSVIETVKCYGLSALLSFGILLILQLFVNHVLVYFVSGTLLLASILANLVKWIPKEKISPEAKAVFITGCDRGFGYMLAQRLDDIGFHVFAGCLFPEGDGAANLRKSGSDRLHVLGLDVTSENSVQEAAAYVKENLKENGCDSGFGYMLAQRLNDFGFHVFAGCLLPDGDGATNLRKEGSGRLHVFGLDVTSEISVQEASDYIKENLKQNVLWAVVNNAGIGTAGELDWISFETIQKIIEVNTLGVVRVTKAFLPELKESKGRILTVTSIVGRSPCPGLVPYCMSKAAAISFCDGLRLEMYKWGIQVITIEPANYRTTIINPEVIAKTMRQEWEKAPQDVKDTYTSNYINKFTKIAVAVPHYFSRDPIELVSVMEEAVTSLCPEYYYTSGNFIFRLMVWLSQNLPRPISDAFAFFIFIMDLK